MSLPILIPTDFKGYYAISLNEFSEAKFQLYINMVTKEKLRDLLSDQCFADISTQSTLQQKYVDLLNGCIYTNDEGKKIVSQGFKEVLKGMVYYQYNIDNWSNTIVGNTQNKNENSTNVNDGRNRQICYSRYNYGVEIYTKEVIPFIQMFELMNQPINSFIDNLDNTYTINVSSTKYLYINDKVEINGIEYNVDDLIENTSITITSLTPIIPTGEIAYEPFKDYNLINLQLAW